MEQKTLEGFNARGARVGMTGAVRVGAIGLPPVKFAEKYDNTKHRNVGYLAPDGLEISFDEDKQEYIPWQEVNSIRTDITKAVKSIKFTLWETTSDNLAKFLGVSEDELVNGEDGSVSFWEGSLPEFPHEWLSLDVVDGDKHLRLTLPDAQITGRGALQFKKDEMVGLELTYSTFPASSEDYAGVAEGVAVGKTANWQVNKGWATGGGETTSATDGVVQLQVATATLPKATPKGEYKSTVTATGGTSPYTWSATGLPSGFKIDSASGEITGTAGDSVTSTEVTVKVTDKSGLTATKKLTISE